jgi:mxaJ protein
MSSLFHKGIVCVMLLTLGLIASGCASRDLVPAKRSVLRVCADPNNLPYSNAKGEGFENKIAELLANEMHADLEYTWWAQRRGYVRNTLDSCKCDVLIGVPRVAERTLNTASYYRSSYVFVYPTASHLNLASLDDARLKHLRIGVQIVAGDYTNTPPVLALNRRHIIQNIRGFSVFGDYSKPDPPMDALRALERGEIDVAIVWGPHGGYYAKQSAIPLTVVPVSPHIDLPYLPFIYDISMGVRRSNDTLRNKLDDIIRRRRPALDSILEVYGIPLIPDGPISNTSTVTAQTSVKERND